MSDYHEHYTNFHNFYEAAKTPIIAQIVYLKSAGEYDVLNGKSYYEIIKDINEAHEFNFKITDTKRFL